jgi:hypothetical protein
MSTVAGRPAGAELVVPSGMVAAGIGGVYREALREQVSSEASCQPDGMFRRRKLMTSEDIVVEGSR